MKLIDVVPKKLLEEGDVKDVPMPKDARKLDNKSFNDDAFVAMIIKNGFQILMRIEEEDNDLWGVKGAQLASSYAKWKRKKLTPKEYEDAGDEIPVISYIMKDKSRGFISQRIGKGTFNTYATHSWVHAKNKFVVKMFKYPQIP